MRVIPGITNTHAERHNRACVVVLFTLSFHSSLQQIPTCAFSLAAQQESRGCMSLTPGRLREDLPSTKEPHNGRQNQTQQEARLAPLHREANMGGSVNRGAARSTGEAGDLMCPVLADGGNIRLEATRRHSVIRLIDKEPDQCSAEPTSALWAVFPLICGLSERLICARLT